MAAVKKMIPNTNRPVAHLQGLYTVVVGVALAAAISSVIDQTSVLPIRLGAIPYFIAYLMTLVPIYHGALRHLDAAYVENSREPRAGALMVDWGLLFVESCGLLALALLIGRPKAFSYAIAGLLAFDALWAFGAYLAFTPAAHEPERQAEQKWAVVNSIAVLALIGIIIGLDSLDGEKPVNVYRWILVLTVASARTIWDYSWCWNFYFPKRTT